MENGELDSTTYSCDLNGMTCKNQHVEKISKPR